MSNTFNWVDFTPFQLFSSILNTALNSALFFIKGNLSPKPNPIDLNTVEFFCNKDNFKCLSSSPTVLP